MSHKRKLIGSLVVLAAIVATGAVNISSGASSPTANSVVSALSTPVTNAHLIAARETFEQVAAKGVDPSTPPGEADLAKAVPTSIAGSDELAWLAPQGDGICLFVPSPAGNYGSSCFSATRISEGVAVVMTLKANGDEKGTVTVAQIVADGNSGPSVTSADGSKSSIAVESNVAAAVLPASDTVSTGQGEVALSSLIQKPTFHNP
jgi:hypothetical protein